MLLSKSLTIAALSLTSFSNLQANNNTWTGSNGSAWGDASNWSNGLPNYSSDLIFNNNASTTDIFLDYNLLGSSFLCDSLSFKGSTYSLNSGLIKGGYTLDILSSNGDAVTIDPNCGAQFSNFDLNLLNSSQINIGQGGSLTLVNSNFVANSFGGIVDFNENEKQSPLSASPLSYALDLTINGPGSLSTGLLLKSELDALKKPIFYSYFNNVYLNNLSGTNQIYSLPVALGTIYLNDSNITFTKASIASPVELVSGTIQGDVVFNNYFQSDVGSKIYPSLNGAPGQIYFSSGFTPEPAANSNDALKATPVQLDNLALLNSDITLNLYDSKTSDIIICDGLMTLGSCSFNLNMLSEDPTLGGFYSIVNAQELILQNPGSISVNLLNYSPNQYQVFINDPSYNDGIYVAVFGTSTWIGQSGSVFGSASSWKENLSPIETSNTFFGQSYGGTVIFTDKKNSCNSLLIDGTNYAFTSDASSNLIITGIGEAVIALTGNANLTLSNLDVSTVFNGSIIIGNSSSLVNSGNLQLAQQIKYPINSIIGPGSFSNVYLSSENPGSLSAEGVLNLQNLSFNNLGGQISTGTISASNVVFTNNDYNSNTAQILGSMVFSGGTFINDSSDLNLKFPTSFSSLNVINKENSDAQIYFDAFAGRVIHNFQNVNISNSVNINGSDDIAVLSLIGSINGTTQIGSSGALTGSLSLSGFFNSNGLMMPGSVYVPGHPTVSVDNPSLGTISINTQSGTVDTAGLFFKINGSYSDQLITNGTFNIINSTIYPIILERPSGSVATYRLVKGSNLLDNGIAFEYFNGYQASQFTPVINGSFIDLTVRYPTTLTWNGNNSSDWFTPTNWSPNATPDINDVVFSSGTTSVLVNQNGSCNSLSFYNKKYIFTPDVTGSLAIYGQSGNLITVGGSSQFLSYIDLSFLSSGTISVSGTSAFYNYGNIFGFSGYPYDLILSGSGSIYNYSQIGSDDHGFSSIYLNNIQLNNYGTVGTGAGTIFANGLSGLLYDSIVDAPFLLNSGTIAGGGTFTKDFYSSDLSTIDASIDNQGALLNFLGNADINGTLAVICGSNSNSSLLNFESGASFGTITFRPDVLDGINGTVGIKDYTIFQFAGKVDPSNLNLTFIPPEGFTAQQFDFQVVADQGILYVNYPGSMTWIGTNDDYYANTPSNWSSGNIPGLFNDLTFDLNGTPTVDLDNSYLLSESIQINGTSYQFGNGLIFINSLNGTVLSISENLNCTLSTDLTTLNPGDIRIAENSTLQLTQNSAISGSGCDLTFSGPGTFINELGYVSVQSGSATPYTTLLFNSLDLIQTGGGLENLNGTIVFSNTNLNLFDFIKASDSTQINGPVFMKGGNFYNYASNLIFDDSTILESTPIIYSGSVSTITLRQGKNSWTDVDVELTNLIISVPYASNYFSELYVTGTVNTMGEKGGPSINAYPNSTLKGSATINGLFYSQKSDVMPGSDQEIGGFTFNSFVQNSESSSAIIDAPLTAAFLSSNINIKLNNTLSDRLTINGTAAFSGTTAINFSVLNPSNGPSTYTFLSADTLDYDNPTLGNSGTLTFSYPQGYDPSLFSIIYGQNSLSLFANFPSNNPQPIPTPFPNPSSFTGAASTTAALLNQISGNCSPETQAIIDLIAKLNPAQQEAALLQLGPQFKVVQFSLEKLSFEIQKELDYNLYGSNPDTNFFVLGGYDYLKQSSRGSYPGYDVNSLYQLVGATHGFTHVKVMGAIGASESWMKLFPLSSKASYNTVYATAGVSGAFHNFQAGVKALFGYSFVDASRGVSFIDEKAHTSHGAYNINTEARLSYTVKADDFNFTPYNSFGYIYGQETSYHEHGAPGANLKVKDEILSLCRNSFGANFEGNIHHAIRPFADLAWVYEFYNNNNTYKAAFIGTDVYGTYSQQVPTKNYGRAQVGLMGEYKDFDWKVSYTGLFGKRFMEQTASVKLGYKF